MKRPRSASSSSSAASRARLAETPTHPPETYDLEQERKLGQVRRARAGAVLSGLVASFRASKPGVCKWLSTEDHILPEIVNIVYTIDFHSKAFKTPLDMIRMAQYLPNCKFRPPSFPSATLRIWPVTALVYQECNAVIIKTTSPGEALYQSHVLRQLLEQIPFIMKYSDTNCDGSPAVASVDRNKLFVGTLEGLMGFRRGKIDNIVGSGMLYQDGVSLTDLMHAKDAHVDWDPGAFPNAIYRNRLPDGTLFCSNIASTQKVVIMGVKRLRPFYKAYKMTCKVVNAFEDPDMPKDPVLRRQYGLNQLYARNEILLFDSSHSAVKDMFDHTHIERMARMMRDEDRDQSAHEEEHDDNPVNAIDKHFAMVNALFEQRRAQHPVPGAVAVAVATNTVAPLHQQQQQTAVPMGFYHLLRQAALLEQVSNVEFMLSDASPETIAAVWQKDAVTNKTIYDEMATSGAEKHKQIMHMFKDFMEANPVSVIE